jgi:hypothetical protein
MHLTTWFCKLRCCKWSMKRCSQRVWKRSMKRCSIFNLRCCKWSMKRCSKRGWKWSMKRCSSCNLRCCKWSMKRCSKRGWKWSMKRCSIFNLRCGKWAMTRGPKRGWWGGHAVHLHIGSTPPPHALPMTWCNLYCSHLCEGVRECGGCMLLHPHGYDALMSYWFHLPSFRTLGEGHSDPTLPSPPFRGRPAAGGRAKWGQSDLLQMS